MHLRVFYCLSMIIEVYHQYSEFKPTLDSIKASAKKDRYVDVTSLGKSSGGNEMYFVVIAKNKDAVDKYLAQVSEMYNNPAALQNNVEVKKDSNFKVTMWFNNVHPDEAPGSDAILRLANDFATKDKISYRNRKALEASNTPVVTDVDVNSVLDNLILVFNVTENPDGRIANRRANINGFDLNRDYGYQTQVESRNFAQGVNKWAPTSLIDFHGFYPEMVIEPCTPPHNPNYEYDLLIDGMLPQSYIMGKAAVANTKYLSYDIPYVDYKDSFDDATPCYTSTYAMFQGALGTTFEIPELNEDSFNALVNGGYAAINYIYSNKIKLFNNQLEMYKRQVNNEDNKSVDRYYIDANGYQIGRERGDKENYFPELRGFDCYEVRMPSVFDNVTTEVKTVEQVGTIIDKATNKYVIKNNSNDAVSAINQLLKDGKTVRMVTEKSDKYDVGDYVVSNSDLDNIKSKYSLNAVAMDKDLKTKDLKKVKVYALKFSSSSAQGQVTEETGFVLNQMGFDVVSDIKDADIVVDSTGSAYKDSDMKAYIESGKPYIAIGGNALNFINDSKLIQGLEIKTMQNSEAEAPYEGAVQGILSENNNITRGYLSDEILYFSLGTFITKAPSDAIIFEKISDKDNFFKAGWWPGHEVLKGQIAGVQYKNMILFANDITNKAHTANEFRLLSNAIYSFQVK